MQNTPNEPNTEMVVINIPDTSENNLQPNLQGPTNQAVTMNTVDSNNHRILESRENRDSFLSLQLDSGNSINTGNCFFNSLAYSLNQANNSNQCTAENLQEKVHELYHVDFKTKINEIQKILEQSASYTEIKENEKISLVENINKSTTAKFIFTLHLLILGLVIAGATFTSSILREARAEAWKEVLAVIGNLLALVVAFYITWDSGKSTYKTYKQNKLKKNITKALTANVKHGIKLDNGEWLIKNMPLIKIEAVQYNDFLKIRNDANKLLCDDVTYCPAFFIAAKAEYFLARYDDAERHIRNFLANETVEDSFLAEFLRGNIYLRLGRQYQSVDYYQKAKKQFNRLLSKSPHHPILHSALAKAFYGLYAISSHPEKKEKNFIAAKNAIIDTINTLQEYRVTLAQGYANPNIELDYDRANYLINIIMSYLLSNLLFAIQLAVDASSFFFSQTEYDKAYRSIEFANTCREIFAKRATDIQSNKMTTEMIEVKKGFSGASKSYTIDNSLFKFNPFSWSTDRGVLNDTYREISNKINDIKNKINSLNQPTQWQNNRAPLNANQSLRTQWDPLNQSSLSRIPCFFLTTLAQKLSFIEKGLADAFENLDSISNEGNVLLPNLTHPSPA